MATPIQTLRRDAARKVAPEAYEGKGKSFQAGPWRKQYVTGANARQKTARLNRALGPRGNFGPGLK